MRTAVGAAGVLVGLMTLFVTAPGAAASPDGEFCDAMAGVGYTGDCGTIVDLATEVCAQYDLGVPWETVVADVDAQTSDELLSNFVVAGAPMYFCPEHSGKI